MPTDQYAQSQPADILVVDDTIANLRLLTDILTNAGYRVRPAEQSQLALESALAQTPSLILLDVKMPEMDGFELCRQLKQDERTRDVPIIFISASQDVSDRVGGFEAGGVDFVSKPFQELEVLARVKNHLRLYYMQSHLEDMVAERTLALEKEMASHKESESRFRATFEQAAVGIAHVSPEGSFLRINQKFCEIVGYSQKEMLEGAFQDITHPDDLELDLDNVNKLLEGELETYTMEKRYLHKNGAIIWVNLTVSLLRTSAGKPDYFISVIEEITDKKATESQLRESEEKFRAVVDQSPIAIQIHGLDGKLITSNAAWRELNDFDDEVLAEVKEKYSILEDEQARELGIMPSIETVYAGESVEFPLYSYTVFDTLEKLDFANSVPMPRTRWIQTRGFPLKDEAGRVTSAVFMSEDITEQKLAEDNLKQSEERFRSLMEQSPLSIQICDKNGWVVDGNLAWRKLWNISEEDMPYVKANYNILNDEEVKKRGILPLIEKAFAGEAVQVPDFFYESAGAMDVIGLVKEKSKAVWIRMTLYPVKDEEGNIKNVISIEEDITKRKQADEKLKEKEVELKGNEAILSALLENSLDLIAYRDMKGCLVMFNEAFTKLVWDVFAIKAVPGLRTMDTQGLAFKDRWEGILKKVIEGEPYHDEFSWESKTGEMQYFEIAIRRIVMDGKVIGTAEFTRNITERKKAEQERNRLYDLSVDMIGITTFDGTIKQINPAWEVILGYSIDELISTRFLDYIHPDDIQKTNKEVERLAAGNKTVNFENRYKHKDGSIRHISWTATPLVAEDSIYCIGRDITDRKKADLAIIESEEKFRLLVEQSPYSIQIFNTDGYLDQVNTSFQELWGIDDQSLLEVLENYNVLEDEEAEKFGVRKAIQKAFNGESVVLPIIEYDARNTMDKLTIDTKANIKWVQSRFYPVKYDQGEVVKVVSMEEDMTEVKMKENEILNYQQRLKDLALELTFSEEKQRKEIASELHDDVGQLLASSRMQIAAIDPQISKSDIFDELNCISTGLLSAIKATRRAIFELSPPQLNEIGLVAALADWMEEEVEVKHGIKAVVMGDDKRFDITNEERFLLFRCVRELLVNVIKHAQANKVALRIVKENDFLTICVEDNGIGMDKNRNLKDPKQSGFGLFSIEERIQNMGGSIDIHSKLGSGTQITLFLPLNK